MKDFMHEHFDKMLLVALILMFLAVAVFNHGPDFAVRTIDVLVGALIGIITGRFLKGDANANKQSPTGPSTDVEPSSGRVS